MYNPSLKEFLRLSERANVIPVYKEINADLDTPVSAFLKLKKDAYAFLLESVEGQEKIARYSFLGTQPSIIFKGKGKNIHIIYPRRKCERKFITPLNPLDELKKIMQDFNSVQVKGLPRFYGGFVGYIGYDIVRFFEELPDKNPDDLNLQDCLFVLADTLLAFDHIHHTIKIISNIILPLQYKKFSRREKIEIYSGAIKKIETLHRQLQTPFVKKDKKVQRCRLPLKIISNFKKSEFCAIIKKAKEYIRRGDIIQVVLSQRFKTRINKDPLDIYRALRSLNPSPYMFFLKLGELTLIGSSPEMLVRCEDSLVETRPIAGTRKRGETEEEDGLLEKQLLNDSKEKAEHLMLVDLGRNDLGRVCKTGSVKVKEFMVVERYSHLMHLVSDVSAQRDKRHNSYDVLKACFPAGTVTGSPKIRAMEIIDELENLRRGPYAGCVGYFSFSQNMDTCITIRTIVIKDNTAYIQAGAGIVLDSVPEKEYLESVNKARVLVEALRGGLPLS